VKGIEIMYQKLRLKYWEKRWEKARKKLVGHHASLVKPYEEMTVKEKADTLRVFTLGAESKLTVRDITNEAI